MRNARHAGTQTSIDAMNSDASDVRRPIFVWMLAWVLACDAYGIVAAATPE
jgi:hypothetical protein